MSSWSDSNSTDDLDQSEVVLNDSSGAPIGQSPTNPIYVSGNQMPVAPGDIVIHSVTDLMDGVSTSQVVNGSVTPVVFSAGPPAGQVWYVYAIKFLFADGGNAKIDSYAGIASGLTNGLLVEQTVNSVDYELHNLKNNADAVEIFTNNPFAGGNSGFITDSNFYSGVKVMSPQVTLTGDDSDAIKVTVRDNLTGLIAQEMAIGYFRIV